MRDRVTGGSVIGSHPLPDSPLREDSIGKGS